MKKAIPKVRGGKRPGAGRKPTGRDPARTFRLSDELIAELDAWAARQDDSPSRSEAIRRLVEMGLKVKQK
jgi:Ribbon-helix-helix protein, copG family